MNGFFDKLEKLILKLAGKSNTSNTDINTSNTNINTNNDSFNNETDNSEGIYNMPVKEKVSLLDRIKTLKKQPKNDSNYNDQTVDNSKNILFILCIVVGISLMVLSICFILTKNHAKSYMDELTKSKVFNYSYVDIKNGTVLEFPAKVKYNKKNIKVKYEILEGEQYLTLNNGKYYINTDSGEVIIKYKATCFGLQCKDERTVKYTIKPMCEEIYNNIITYENYNKVIDKYTVINVANYYKDATVLSNLTLLDGKNVLKISLDSQGQHIKPIVEGTATVSYGLTYGLCSDTLEKKYEVKYTRHTVKFNSNGGSEIQSQNVVIDEKASKPADPIKERYVFEGWTLGDKLYDFNTLVTKDITLKATWSEGLELVINVNGGNMPSGLKEINYYRAGTKITLKTPTKKGYKFVRWSASSGKIVGNTFTMPEGDATVTAMWQRN